MHNWPERLKNSLASLLFPPLCLHCEAVLDEKEKLLCFLCQNTLELLEPFNRCPLCFGTYIDTICKRCIDHAPAWNQLIACFEYKNAARSLLLNFKYGDKPYLAKSLASFMLLQYNSYNLPLPDLITYIPQSFLRAMTRGYNQSKLLAHHFAALIDCPVVGLLTKSHFTLSQTMLTKEERSSLVLDSFSLKDAMQVKDKNILIIDDIFTTGATLNAASQALKNGGVKAVFAFTCYYNEQMDN